MMRWLSIGSLVCLSLAVLACKSAESTAPPPVANVPFKALTVRLKEGQALEHYARASQVVVEYRFSGKEPVLLGRYVNLEHTESMPVVARKVKGRWMVSELAGMEGEAWVYAGESAERHELW
ncbi:MAG: hypothetical protein WCI73_18845, partial [Phycisphaerae bacterium]